MPDGFFYPNRSIGLNEAGDLGEAVFSTHPIQHGKNQGGANNYDPTSANLNSTDCLSYNKFVNEIVQSPYPNPTRALRDALNIKFGHFRSESDRNLGDSVCLLLPLLFASIGCLCVFLNLDYYYFVIYLAPI
jgi:hypothetical protein